MQETLVQFLGWEDPVFLGFPRGSTGKESAYNMGDLGLMPGLRRFPGEGKGYSLHNPGLENSMDYIIHGVAKSQTRLSDFHFQSSGRIFHSFYKLYARKKGLPLAGVLAQAAITEYQRLGGLNNRHFISLSIRV